MLCYRNVNGKICSVGTCMLQWVLGTNYVCCMSFEIYVAWHLEIVLWSCWWLHCWVDVLQSIDWSAAAYAFADDVCELSPVLHMSKWTWTRHIFGGWGWDQEINTSGNELTLQRQPAAQRRQLCAEASLDNNVWVQLWWVAECCTDAFKCRYADLGSAWCKASVSHTMHNGCMMKLAGGSSTSKFQPPQHGQGAASYTFVMAERLSFVHGMCWCLDLRARAAVSVITHGSQSMTGGVSHQTGMRWWMTLSLDNR